MRARGLGVVCAASITAATMASSPADGAPPAWSDWSASPRAVDATQLDPLERAALQACGPGEAGLEDAARAILERKLRGQPIPELDAIEAMQRAAGEPHPWPRVWAASARSLEGEATRTKLAAWLDATSTPERRCGVAAGTSREGVHALVVIAVDALADLAPLPTRARAGQWLTVEARLRARATGGRVMVMGATGAPREVPTWFDGTTLHARFAPERPGEVAVQVVADLPSGPRPVLEATVLAEVEPPSSDAPRAAPGEDAATVAGSGDDTQLALMVAAARASVGLPPLSRDGRLDEVARQHAARMAAAHELAHDTGDGDPMERMHAAGLDPRDAGENVAHAPSVPLAHRALWSSPSHRANLLGRGFERVGVAAVRDARGEVWAVETFAGRMR